jgi:hypothetical protein
VDAEDGADKWWTQLAAYQYQPRWKAVQECLELSYQMRGNVDYRKRAREGAVRYDADLVAEKYWKPVLEKISTKIGQTTLLDPKYVIDTSEQVLP